MPFEKGQSGNPGGRPKENAEVKALARSHGVAAVQKIVGLMNSADEKTVLAACQALLDRGFGKPAQVLVGDDDEPPISVKEILIRAVDAASDRPSKES
jgi:hypothetical protein